MITPTGYTIQPYPLIPLTFLIPQKTIITIQPSHHIINLPLQRLLQAYQHHRWCTNTSLSLSGNKPDLRQQAGQTIAPGALAGVEVEAGTGTGTGAGANDIGTGMGISIGIDIGRGRA